MKVLVCIKRVPSPGAQIVLSEDGTAIDTRHLGFTVSPHEECAAEEAVRLVAAHGGSSTVLTLGPPAAHEQLRVAISMGVDHGVLLPTDGAEWGPGATAAAIADAISVLEAEDGPFDLVLFGHESADAGNAQVGVRVAHRLARPIVTGCTAIASVSEPRDSAADPDPGPAAGTVALHRGVEGGSEVCRVPLPAVVAVKEGINLPRYPAMRGRLRAAKVPIRELVPEAPPDGSPRACGALDATTTGLRHPHRAETETVILGSGADAVPGVLRVLEEVGLL